MYVYRPIQWVPAYSQGRDVNHTPHLASRAITLLSLWVFMACCRVNFTCFAVIYTVYMHIHAYIFSALS